MEIACDNTPLYFHQQVVTKAKSAIIQYWETHQGPVFTYSYFYFTDINNYWGCKLLQDT